MIRHLLALAFLNVSTFADAQSTDPGPAVSDRVLSTAARMASGADPAAYTDLRSLTSAGFLGAASGGSADNRSLLDFDSRYRQNLASALLEGSSQAVTQGIYHEYVWGGKRTDDYPYVLGVVGSRTLCTGVLVSDRLLITASHCTCNNPFLHATTGSSVWKGKQLNLSGRSWTLGDVNCENEEYGRDIAALELSQGAGQPLANLPTPTILRTFLLTPPPTLRVVGHGWTHGDAATLGERNYADVPLASLNCKGYVTVDLSGDKKQISDADYYGCLPSFDLVAGGVNLDVDSCSGDSGGPLLYMKANEPPVVMALSSRNVTRQRACGDGGVYSLVDQTVVDWIAPIVKDVKKTY